MRAPQPKKASPGSRSRLVFLAHGFARHTNSLHIQNDPARRLLRLEMITLNLAAAFRWAAPAKNIGPRITPAGARAAGKRQGARRFSQPEVTPVRARSRRGGPGRRTGAGGRRGNRGPPPRPAPRRAGRRRPGAPGRSRRSPHARPPWVAGAWPAGGRVGPVFGQPLLHQQVSDPLHALAGHAHGPGDPRDGPRLAQHRAEHLPPGRRQPGRPGQPLRHLEELAVQPEDGQRGGREQVSRLAHAFINTSYAEASLLLNSRNQASRTSGR